jgi:hypothetical protein
MKNKINTKKLLIGFLCFSMLLLLIYLIACVMMNKSGDTFKYAPYPTCGKEGDNVYNSEKFPKTPVNCCKGLKLVNDGTGTMRCTSPTFPHVEK